MGHRMLQLHFFSTDSRCHGNEIWDKMGYNSACVRDFWEISAANFIFLRPTFEIKLFDFFTGLNGH